MISRRREAIATRMSAANRSMPPPPRRNRNASASAPRVGFNSEPSAAARLARQAIGRSRRRRQPLTAPEAAARTAARNIIIPLNKDIFSEGAIVEVDVRRAGKQNLSERQVGYVTKVDAEKRKVSVRYTAASLLSQDVSERRLHQSSMAQLNDHSGTRSGRRVSFGGVAAASVAAASVPRSVSARVVTAAASPAIKEATIQSFMRDAGRGSQKGQGLAPRPACERGKPPSAKEYPNSIQHT